LKAPRGFGKRYFTLASIQAHSVESEQNGLRVCLETYACALHRDRESDEDPPEEPLTALACLAHDKPCHCDCYFRHRTSLTLRERRKKSPCNCNCRFYSFRRTGVHPPSF
jgi:hypothetical protein